MDTDATWTTPARPASVLPASTPTTIRAALPRGRPPPRSGERRRVASTSDDQIWRPPFLFLFFFRARVRHPALLRYLLPLPLAFMFACVSNSTTTARIFVRESGILRSCDTSFFSCASQESCRFFYHVCLRLEFYYHSSSLFSLSLSIYLSFVYFLGNNCCLSYSCVKSCKVHTNFIASATMKVFISFSVHVFSKRMIYAGTVPLCSVRSGR
jgi:hypothetical protein